MFNFNINQIMRTMKKTIFKLPIVAMLVIGLTVAIVSCSKSDDVVTPPAVPEVTMRIPRASEDGSYLFEARFNTLSNTWSSGGSSFKLFLSQGTGISYVGTKKSNETDVEDKTSDLTVNVPITSVINTDFSYNIIAVDYDCETNLDKGAVLCKADLRRGRPLHVQGWYLSEASSVKISKAIPHYLTSSECLYIKNYSGKNIKVKHKGYEATEKWYYTKADVKLINDNGIKAVVEGKAIDAEVISNELEIEPDSTRGILSSFVPTGKLMSNASLILEIDGKEVKTVPASSSKPIEIGKPYFLCVTWDGSKLEWIGDTSGKPENHTGGEPSNGH